MTNPYDETTLMLLRAAMKFKDDQSAKKFLSQRFRSLACGAGHFNSMAAAVVAEREVWEKVLREALLNAANQFEFYRYQHMSKNPPDAAKAQTNADYRDACLAALDAKP